MVRRITPETRILALVALALLVAGPVAAAEPGAAFIPPLWSVLPFVGMLASIALIPPFAPIFWARAYPLVCLLWFGMAFGAMYGSLPRELGFAAAFAAPCLSSLEEYVAFIVLLGTLYVVCGGIHVSGHLPGVPLVNTGILLIGSVLASLIGTTGASMVLVHPLLRANEGRRYRAHVMVFFIFLAGNIGGVLTPIGDPPLFLGYLKGIPFLWPLTLFPMWGLCVGLLLLLFLAADWMLARREGLDCSVKGLHFRIAGKHNIALLLGVNAVVLIGGMARFDLSLVLGRWGELRVASLLRDGMLILLAAASVRLTKHSVRRANNFSFVPIREVAILFCAIFFTMIPALMLLSGRGGELGLDSPAKFFWLSGALSSFLANAPTYLAFLATGLGALGLHGAAQMTQTHQGGLILEAISAGSVFMGANTYLGNGPNFMVKAIAEQHGVKMPGFLGYLVYSGLILMPLFLLVTVVFF